MTEKTFKVVLLEGNTSLFSRVLPKMPWKTNAPHRSYSVLEIGTSARSSKQRLKK